MKNMQRPGITKAIAAMVKKVVFSPYLLSIALARKPQATPNRSRMPHKSPKKRPLRLTNQVFIMIRDGISTKRTPMPYNSPCVAIRAFTS